MQVQPVAQTFVAQSASPQNAILAAVGPRFALVPKIYPYAEGCGTPSLPQSISIVAVGDIQSPMHLKQVVNQVNSSAQPAPFTSHIPQSTCLCFNDAHRGLFDEQQVMDAGGSPVFSLESVWKCGMVQGCYKVFSVVDAQKAEIGHLRYNSPSCGHVCATAICLFVCRTATLPEWAWLSAVDPHDRERLTFRVPAQEGQCMLCMNCYQPAQYNNCCSTIPDIPFHVHADLYGPMGQAGAIGAIDVRGAYGWDQWLCCQKFGARPEIMTTINLTQALSFEDTTLAIQMALERTQAQLEWRYQDGRKHKLEFLKPGQVTMA